MATLLDKSRNYAERTLPRFGERRGLRIFRQQHTMYSPPPPPIPLAVFLYSILTFLLGNTEIERIQQLEKVGFVVPNKSLKRLKHFCFPSAGLFIHSTYSSPLPLPPFLLIVVPQYWICFAEKDKTSEEDIKKEAEEEIAQKKELLEQNPTLKRAYLC